MMVLQQASPSLHSLTPQPKPPLPTAEAVGWQSLVKEYSWGWGWGGGGHGC